jgi:hypothetical protein
MAIKKKHWLNKYFFLNLILNKYQVGLILHILLTHKKIYFKKIIFIQIT